MRKHFLRKYPCSQLGNIMSIEMCFVEVLGETAPNSIISTKNSHKNPQKSHKNPQKSHKNPQKSHKNPQKSTKTYVCEFCNKEYSRNDSLKRHIDKFCKKTKKQSDQSSLLELMSQQMEHQNKQMEEMRKQHALEIEKLLEKVGNSNINNNITTNQNVFINSHGHENLDYITGRYLNNLLKIPYGAIPKLLKNIHFHPDHPENCNVKITNKKLRYAKVWEGDKWNVKDKKEVIENMVDKGFNIIDSQYISNKECLDPIKKKKYAIFQQKFEKPDKILHKNLEKDTEMIILNNS